MKNLVLLGGGYGNMRIMQRLLPNTLPAEYNITLIDKIPFHGLKTEFYALAAGTESDKDVRVEFPQDKRLNIVYGEVTQIDLEKQIVSIGENHVDYDELVIGLGCEDKYHNVPGAEEYTYSIQTMTKARKTYQAIADLPSGSTVGIVGAGLSGIELASELRESRKDLKIQLFDRGERILPAFPEKLSNYVKKWFDKNDVEVIPNSNVVKVEPGTLYNNDVSYSVDICVWTAGIQPVEIVRNLPVEIGDGNRVKLNQYHQIPTHPNVYVVGDCAALPHAPSAQLAEVQAEQIIDVMKMIWTDKPLPEVMPELKLQGFMGSLGEKEGFAYLMEKTVTGRLARLMKSGVLWLYKYHNG
ncbi:FAD-dependent oxidoreductase [Macrococcus epidermidis]|uniref:Type II NADH:quinone oxidoreductase n=1 Tax=Macrococcus epidermidis TaxID=1902580 RepID=A0A327ZUV7_9STAP|nr:MULTISPECIES: NAD(P)/FAD-dependent oxidoreductase [Macrococcus]MCG7419388.1 NAD(P)/FAD-dependent oxidoreductase [Macrococcus epidermidis]MCH4984957.1 NAD(P)/FAD-dependent oxidoreductase [Macrococcus sp. PK]RAK46190.1 FAD-dependent oxidoreductase [Macrococcus epidermidis]UTH17003.1 NAD(P)/FAD-dependent oxidoreductase [Macrococcus epidermidis]